MRIHPLVAGAAVSVILLSGVGIAAITGVLPTSSAKIDAGESAPAAAKKECATCGVVIDVKLVEQKGEGTGLGAVVGGVAGAVVGREISDGRDVGTVVGAAGGAIAGHQIERHARTTKHYQVQVRMADGSVKNVRYSARPAWKAGDKVRLQDGKLVSA
jgi:outer membrane lipoprotein SlyB